jgi:hypothetical protein
MAVVFALPLAVGIGFLLRERFTGPQPH